MDWLQVLTILLGNFVMFFWLRGESNADRRETHQILREIKDEQKDFHARLCILEERYLALREKT